MHHKKSSYTDSSSSNSLFNENPHRGHKSGGDTTPPRQHSPSIVRGVSTLGRKFSKRIEKFSDSDTGRKFRMASPSRKYHFTLGSSSRSTSEPSSNRPNKEDNKINSQPGNNHNGSLSIGTANKNQIGEISSMDSKQQKSRVSRVDSFRNFFLLTTAATSLKTPRAVKRRSNRNHHPHNPAYDSPSSKFSDASTSTSKHNSETDVRKGGFSRSLSSGGSKKDSMFNNQKFNNSSMNSFGNFGSELTLTDCQSETGISDYYSEVEMPRFYKGNDGSSNDINRSNGLHQYYTDDEYDKRSVVSDSHHMSNNVYQQPRHFQQPNKRSLQQTQESPGSSNQYSRNHQLTNGSINHHRSASNLKLGILPENRAINFQEPFVVYNATNGLQIKSYGLIDDKVDQKRDISDRSCYDVKKGVGNISEDKICETEMKESGKEDQEKNKPNNVSHESGYSSDNATSGAASENSSRNSPRVSPLECQERSADDSLNKNIRDRILAEKLQNPSSSSSNASRSLTPSPPTVTSDLPKTTSRLAPKALHPSLTETRSLSNIPTPKIVDSRCNTPSNYNTKPSSSSSNSNIPPKKPARTKIPLGVRMSSSNISPNDTTSMKTNNTPFSSKSIERMDRNVDGNNDPRDCDRSIMSEHKMSKINTSAQDSNCQNDRRRYAKPKRESKSENKHAHPLEQEGNNKKAGYNTRAPIIDVVAADDEDEGDDDGVEISSITQRNQRQRYLDEHSKENIVGKYNRRGSAIPQSSNYRDDNSPTPVRKEYKMIRLVRNMRTELGIIIAKKKLKDVPTTGFKVVHIEPDGIVER